MAKRKREVPSPAPRQETIKLVPQPSLRPETRHGVLVVVLFALTALSVLSLVNFAGAFGEGFRNGLMLLIGWGRWAVPVLLAVLGLYLARPNRNRVSPTQIIGAFGMVLGLSALLNVFGQDIEAGIGGGVIGALLWSPLTMVMGKFATAIVVLAVSLIGILLLFNTSLTRLFRRGQAVGRIMDSAKDAIQQARDAQAEPAVEFERREVKDERKAEVKPADVAGSAKVEHKRPRLPRKRELTFPLDLLDRTDSKPTSGDIEANKDKIKRTLESFGIQVEMGEVNVGPTVTQFTLKPSEGVKLAQITTLANDLALALAAHPLRIEAPIPGKSLVGIEVPNQKVGTVNLRSILEHENFLKRGSPLSVALGRDVAGHPVVADVDPMPHLLIAGATGSGKSVMINALLLSLLATNTPDELKLILVDPKRVELTNYNDIPHLLTPVITETNKTINALRWVVGEMDRRFKVLSESGKRNIQTYHQDIDDGMPYIVVVIDELADLMAVAANEVEAAIVRLAQMARAVGIHLVLATQRPSVDVITGLIKANITARIAFTVASTVDSRTILDHSGAEKLLGRGDMLFINAELSKPRRIQGAFVAESEIERVTGFFKEQGNAQYQEEIVEKPTPTLEGGFDDMEDDELLAQAKQVLLQAGKGSASLLQRRLRIGYARAARILDLLEEQGFIGPADGAKPREILVAQSVSGSLDAPPDEPFADEPQPTDEEERNS